MTRSAGICHIISPTSGKISIFFEVQIPTREFCRMQLITLTKIFNRYEEIPVNQELKKGALRASLDIYFLSILQHFPQYVYSRLSNKFLRFVLKKVPTREDGLFRGYSFNEPL